MMATRLFTVSLLLFFSACGEKKPAPEALADPGQSTPEGASAPTEVPLVEASAESQPPLDAPAVALPSGKGPTPTETKAISDALTWMSSPEAADHDRALQAWQQLAAGGNSDPLVAVNLGVTYHLVGRDADAETTWKRVIQEHPEQDDALLFLGVLEQKHGNLAGALGFYERAKAADPKNMRARVALVDALRKSGKPQDAIAEAKSALAISSNSPEIYNNIGLTYVDLKQYDMAVFVFQKALNTIPGADGDALLHCNFGWANYLLDRKLLAAAELKKALELDPTLLPANLYLARLYQEQRNFKDMIPLLERAREQDEGNHGLQMNLGLAYKGVGRLEEAEKAYRRALEIEPGNPDPHFNLAILFGDYIKDYDRSIGEFEAYLSAGGRDAADATSYMDDIRTEKKAAEKKKKREEDRKRKEQERLERDRLLKEAEAAEAAAAANAARVPVVDSAPATDSGPPPGDPNTDAAVNPEGEVQEPVITSTGGSEVPAEADPEPPVDAGEGSQPGAESPNGAPAEDLSVPTVQPAIEVPAGEDVPPEEASEGAAPQDNPWGNP